MEAESSGDEWEGFQEIVGEHDRRLWRFVRSRVRHEQTTEDLCGQTWFVYASLWRTYRQYEAPAAPLYRIARYKVLAWHRERAVADQLWRLEDVASTDNVEDLQGHRDLSSDPETERIHMRADLDRAIGDLPPRQQEAVYLRYELDLDVETIAHYMGIGSDGVKRLLAKAKSNLRKMRALGGYPRRRREDEGEA